MANIFRIQGVANLGKYIDEGYILNVEPYIKEDATWGGGFTEGALEYYRVPGKDGIYGVPCESGLIGIYYNERIFKEAGLENFPETWNEFKDAISGPKKAVDETKEAVKKATTIDVTAGAKNDDKHKEAND